MSTEERRLPADASLVQLRKQAKEVRRADGHATLAAAQYALAKSYGFPSWPKLVLHLRQGAVKRAIAQGDNPALEALIKETPRLAALPFADGGSPLLLAAENNDPSMVEMLVKAGARVTERYAGSGHSALSWAVTCWSPHAAIKLVQLGVKPDLFCAAGIGHLPWVEQFWPGGKLVAKPSHSGSSRYDENGKRLPCPPAKAWDQVSDALYIACRNGKLDVAEWLLDHGADPNWRAFIGSTALGWAEFCEHRELCDLLRSRGASDEILDSEFLAPPRVFALMILVGWGFGAAKVEARLSKDPSLALLRSEWGTLLHAAAFSGDSEVVKVVLRHGADPLALNAQSQTAAEFARVRGREDLAAVLES